MQSRYFLLSEPDSGDGKDSLSRKSGSASIVNAYSKLSEDRTLSCSTALFGIVWFCALILRMLHSRGNTSKWQYNSEVGWIWIMEKLLCP